MEWKKKEKQTKKSQILKRPGKQQVSASSRKKNGNQNKPTTADDGRNKAVKSQDSKIFPNFMALTEVEKAAFFEALNAAKKNVEKSGISTSQGFGTVHDAYLSHANEKEGKAVKLSGERSRKKVAEKTPQSPVAAFQQTFPTNVSTVQHSSSGKSILSLRDEDFNDLFLLNDAFKPQNFTAVAGAGSRATENSEDGRTTAATTSPRGKENSRRVAAEHSDLSVDSPAWDECESILNKDRDKMVDLFLSKKKKQESESHKKGRVGKEKEKGKRQTELQKDGNQRTRNQPDYAIPVQGLWSHVTNRWNKGSQPEEVKTKEEEENKSEVRFSVVGRPKNTSRFDALNREEKEVFFSILKEARENILEKDPGKDDEILSLESIMTRYRAPSEEVVAIYSTTTEGNKGSRKKKLRKGEKNLRVKLTLTSKDNQRLAKEGKSVVHPGEEDSPVERKAERGEKGKGDNDLEEPLHEEHWEEPSTQTKFPEHRSPEEIEVEKNEKTLPEKKNADDDDEPRKLKPKKSKRGKKNSVAPVDSDILVSGTSEKGKKRKRETSQKGDKEDKTKPSESEEEVEILAQKGKEKIVNNDEKYHQERRKAEAEVEEKKLNEKKQSLENVVETKAIKKEEHSLWGEGVKEEKLPTEGKTQKEVKVENLSGGEPLLVNQTEGELTRAEEKSGRKEGQTEVRLKVEGLRAETEILGKGTESLIVIKPMRIRENESIEKPFERVENSLQVEAKPLLLNKAGESREVDGGGEGSATGILRATSGKIHVEQANLLAEEKKEAECQEVHRTEVKWRKSEFEQFQKEENSMEVKPLMMAETGEDQKKEKEQEENLQGTECLPKDLEEGKNPPEVGLIAETQDKFVVQLSRIETDEGRETEEKRVPVKADEAGYKTEKVVEAGATVFEQKEEAAKEKEGEARGPPAAKKDSEEVLKIKPVEEIPTVAEEVEKKPEHSEQVARSKLGKVVLVDENVIEKIGKLIQDLEERAKPEEHDLENEYLQLLLGYMDYLSRVLECLIGERKERSPHPIQIKRSIIAHPAHLQFDENAMSRKGESQPKTEKEKPNFPRSISDVDLRQPGEEMLLNSGGSAEWGKEMSKSAEKFENVSGHLARSDSESGSSDASENVVRPAPMFVKAKRLPTTKIRLLQDLIKERAKFVEGSTEELKIIKLPEKEFVPSEKKAAKLLLDDDDEQESPEKVGRTKFFRALSKFCRCGRRESREDNAVLENLRGEAVAVDVSEGKRDAASATLNDSTLEVLKAAERKRVIEKYWNAS